MGARSGLRLPWNRVQHSTLRSAWKRPSPFNGRLPMNRNPILLVEDNPDDQTLILRALKKNNILNEVVLVRDGVEALDYLFSTGAHQGRDPDLMPQVVLLDIKLPKLDGLEVLKRIRADERTKRHPVGLRTSSSEHREQTWDLVITDWSMPQFSAPAALELLKSVELDLPFIIVSGTIGEDIAVAAMKAGAHDYLMKNNLARLIPAIERELQEAAGRQERKRAVEALPQSEARLRAVLVSALDAFVGMDAHGIITDWNSRFEAIFGWSRAE